MSLYLKNILVNTKTFTVLDLYVCMTNIFEKHAIIICDLFTQYGPSYILLSNVLRSRPTTKEQTRCRPKYLHRHSRDQVLRFISKIQVYLSNSYHLFGFSGKVSVTN